MKFEAFIFEDGVPVTSLPILPRNSDVNWAAATAAVTLAFDTFVAFGHYVAAVSLLVCIVVVAGINARDPEKARSPRRWYTIFAVLLIVVGAVGMVLAWIGTISVFWVEIAVAACFILFLGWSNLGGDAAVSSSATHVPWRLTSRRSLTIGATRLRC